MYFLRFGSEVYVEKSACVAKCVIARILIFNSKGEEERRRREDDR